MFAEINKPCKFILRSIGRGYKHSSYGNIWECKKVMKKDGINQIYSPFDRRRIQAHVIYGNIRECKKVMKKTASIKKFSN